MLRFPDYFPADAEERIKSKGGEYICQENVYRILPNGEVNHEAFLCTYVDPYAARMHKEPTIATYSTSLSDSFERLQELLNVTMRSKYPNPCIAKGSVVPCCGPSTRPNAKHHIDWWIFEDAAPERYFRKEG